MRIREELCLEVSSGSFYAFYTGKIIKEKIPDGWSDLQPDDKICWSCGQARGVARVIAVRRDDFTFRKL